jgi:protein gp37
MSANTKIEWCDHTFNPWIGCTKVSPGCANCYAEGESRRRGWSEWGKGRERYRTSASYWKQPLIWNRKQTPNAQGPTSNIQPRQRVFCASLADWLDEEVPIAWLADLLGLIYATPNLDWLLLTKRPEGFEARISACAESKFASMRIAAGWRAGYPPHNVWVGTSVEDQDRANERIPLLLQIPAAIHFLSCEPLLGKINLGGPFNGPQRFPLGMGIRWVIVGGESGPKARACRVEWIRDIVKQCQQCRCWEVAVFVKQLGARIVAEESEFPTVHIEYLDGQNQVKSFRLCDRKGGDPEEWPEDLRVRQFPGSFRQPAEVAV